MKVNTLHRKWAVPVVYYYCGSVDHLVKECPCVFDVQTIPVEEQVVMLEQLLAAADIREANTACNIEESDESQGLD
jgi:hypothetical protein